MSGLFDQITNYSPPLLTAGQVNYKGTWDATANSPTLTSPPASTSKGDYYVVSAAGTQFSISFAVGDWIISNGTAWEKVDLTDAVSSVFGRTGAVVGVSTDYSAVGITNTAIGASSPSTGAFTTITATSTITATGAVTGSNLSGTNTGNQTISITGDVTAAGSTGVLTASVTKINGTSLAGLTTGILKNTTTTGVPSIAVAADFPTLNQNTTGSAATLTTSRSIHGGSFNGSADVTNVITGTYGGTGVNNGANTITIAGNVTHAGAFTQTFTATANTALTLPTTGTLATLAGSEALSNKTITASSFSGSVAATTLSTSGDAGFGTASPTQRLQVSSSAGSTYALITNTSTGPSNLFLGAGNATTQLISRDATTGAVPISVIIGTTERANFSSTGLAVTGTSTSSDSMRITTNNVYYRGTTSGGAQQIILGIGADDNTAIVSKSGNTIKMDAGGSTVGTFSSTGLAVTGTLSATGIISSTAGGEIPLRISGGGTGAQVLRVQTTGGDYFFGAEQSAGNYFIAGSTGYDTIIRGPSGIAFSANNGNNMQMRLSSTGLAVAGQASVTSFTGTSALGVRITGSTSTNDYSGIDFSANNQAPRARIGAYYSNNGSYLVFGTSNSYGSGITNSAMTIDYSGNVIVSTLGTGLVYSNSGTLTSTNPSDARLKTDIADLGYGLSSILALRPVSYKWKSDIVNQGTQFGFIAQEVQTIMPDLVKEFETTENGETVTRLGLEKEGIYAALVKAVQELNGLNANLVAQVAALSQRVAALESN